MSIFLINVEKTDKAFDIEETRFTTRKKMGHLAIIKLSFLIVVPSKSSISFFTLLIFFFTKLALVSRMDKKI